VILASSSVLFLNVGGGVLSAMGRNPTLTGRTELWSDALPDIKVEPVLGHGYMTSRFIGMELEERWDAGHLHNAALEILYCNGFIGLAIIAFMIYRAGGNLRRARKSSRRAGAVLVAGAIALAIDLLLNGITEATFGGRPSAFFLFFLALIATSEILQRLAQVPMLQGHADHVTGRYRLATILEKSFSQKPRRATPTN